MNDPFNPTDDELIEWAYDVESVEPVQEWAVSIADLARADLFLRLAADSACPNRIFFLKCLYLLVGDAVRFDGNPSGLAPYRSLFERARQLEEPRLARWVARSQELIAHPETFDFQAWYEGGLAAEEWP